MTETSEHKTSDKVAIRYLGILSLLVVLILLWGVTSVNLLMLSPCAHTPPILSKCRTTRVDVITLRKQVTHFLPALMTLCFEG